MKVKVGLGLLLLLFSFNFLNAKSLFNDHLVSPKAVNVIEKIGSELRDKTYINEYLITTNDKILRGISVYEFINKYSISKPYVAIVFAPNSKRIHVVSSDKGLLKKLDKSEVLDYAIKVIASKDSNTLQSKFDVGLVQAFSELADQVARIKGVKLDNTIKSDGRWVLITVNTLIIVGSLIVIWIYFISPYFRKKRK